MKKLTLLTALVAVLFGGCTKNYYNNNDAKNGYHIDGLAGFTLSQDQPSTYSSLTVTYDGPVQENVTLSVENLPAGLYATIPVPSGYPTFSTYVTFYDSSAAVGDYKVNLVATGDKTGRKVLPFTIKIAAVPECASTLEGVWSGYNYCNSGGNFSENITLVPNVVNRIQFNNFENSGLTLYANIRCSTGNVILPSQTVNGVTYSGSGYFYSSGTTSSLRVNYTKVSSAGSMSCQEILSR